MYITYRAIGEIVGSYGSPKRRSVLTALLKTGFSRVMSQELFEKTPIEDLLIYHPPIYRDERGYFVESFNKKHFEEIGLNCDFVQDNRSLSKKGTLRGFHLQLGGGSQAKLVGVLSGKIFDVAIDLREGSETRGKYHSVVLDADEDPKFFYVPKGFAHGFLVLSDTAEVYYKVDNYYNPQREAGIIYNDSEIGVDWPELDVPLLLSGKDKNLPTYHDFISEFGGRL